MKASDIPNVRNFSRKTLALGDLLQRASSTSRASWADLPQCSGIYIVYWTLDEPPSFENGTGKAKYALATGPQYLQSKWERINQNSPSDIIYIGRNTKRLRVLARFGVGKARNHRGGEWMWQISKIATTRILVQTCPLTGEVGFENWLLEKFHAEHGDYPLANRIGPQGVGRWHPGM